jgi:hypothetical protein
MMSIRRQRGTLIRSAFAAMVLAPLFLIAAPAHSETLLGLKAGAEGRATAPHELSLPRPTGPKTPFRQFKFADCSDPDATCIYKFLTIPANKVLEIDNISCFADTATDQFSYFVLTNSVNLADLLAGSGVAIIPPSPGPSAGKAGRSFADSSGPYFFKAGERVVIFGPGRELSACAISGYLAPTD